MCYMNVRKKLKKKTQVQIQIDKKKYATNIE